MTTIRRRANVPTVSAEPFRQWLLTLRNDYQTHTDMALALGLSERRLNGLLRGEGDRVSLDVVDRVTLREGSVRLDDLYPVDK